MTFRKRTFIEQLYILIHKVSVEPEPDKIQVSPALMAAIDEIEDEATKDRTNWRLVAALTGVKSHICGAMPEDTERYHFWEVKPEGWDENDISDCYGTLDGLNFYVSMHVGNLPSGMTEYIGTPGGIRASHGESDTSASPTSPTLRLIAGEKAAIEEECRRRGWGR